MHDKFMIIDAATLETGSFNFTRAAEYENAENVLVIRGPAMVGGYALIAMGCERYGPGLGFELWLWEEFRAPESRQEDRNQNKLIVLSFVKGRPSSSRKSSGLYFCPNPTLIFAIQ